jgi:hypothetical protein
MECDCVQCGTQLATYIMEESAAEYGELRNYMPPHPQILQPCNMFTLHNTTQFSKLKLLHLGS